MSLSPRIGCVGCAIRDLVVVLSRSCRSESHSSPVIRVADQGQQRCGALWLFREIKGLLTGVRLGLGGMLLVLSFPIKIPHAERALEKEIQTISAHQTFLTRPALTRILVTAINNLLPIILLLQPLINSIDSLPCPHCRGGRSSSNIILHPPRQKRIDLLLQLHRRRT